MNQSLHLITYFYTATLTKTDVLLFQLLGTVLNTYFSRQHLNVTRIKTNEHTSM